VSCYYVREIGGVPTIFSEWMENGSLENRIDDRTLYEGTPEQVQKRLLDIAIQFARGLHYAHESGSGLIHQDVKPDNLLMSKKWDAKVVDFGLARARTAAIVPNGGYTPAYCSPEQSLWEPLTRRTDIYSWAVSILEMYPGEAGGSTDPDCFFLDENFRLVPLAPEVFRNRDQTLFYDAAQVRRFEESRERGDVAEMVRIHRDCLEIPGFGGSREAFQEEYARILGNSIAERNCPFFIY
jgi:serine/threonine protein kinase